MLVLGDPRILVFVVGIERGGKFVIQFSCMCVNSVQFSVFWERDFTVCMKFVGTLTGKGYTAQNVAHHNC
jgi:hypothetical protein